jgi:hypothetical protein
MLDTGSAGVGVMAVDAVVAATDGFIDANDETAGATGPLTTAGLGPFFVDVLSDAGWKVPRPFRRVSASGEFAVDKADAEGPVVAPASGPSELFTASRSFRGRG